MKLSKRKKVVLVSGIAGLGLLALGLWAQRRGSQAISGLGRHQQARVVSSYSDGKMKTVLRADDKMPIEQRIATLQDLVHKSVQDPQMRKLALKITSHCPERDQKCEAQAVYDYVKNNVRYTGDIGPIRHPDGGVEGIDLYQSARRTLEFRGGDCDDNAVVNATLLALNGIEPVFRVVKAKRDPDWSHIFVGAVINGRFVALDTTLPGKGNFNTEGAYHRSIDFPA